MKDVCKRCNGKGNPFCPYNSGFCPKDKKPQTNDEWRRTCSAEEFAEWLIDQFSRIKNDDYMDYRPIGHSFSEIISWLKKEHEESK